MDSILSNAPYHHNKVGQWNANVVEQTLKRLSALNKPFKYIGNIRMFIRVGESRGDIAVWERHSVSSRGERVMNVMSRVITQTREAPSDQSGWKKLSKPSGLYMDEGYLESPNTLLPRINRQTLTVQLY